MTEKELIESLINAFKINYDYWIAFEEYDRARGIQDCINHLYAYLSIKGE
jgi:hypothetical protein